MNDFVNALKEDFSDRRMRPFVGLALALFVGALAYVVLAGGGSSSSSPTPVPHSPLLGAAGGLAVSQTQPASAVGETTSGAAVPHAGSSHDPFALLPGAALLAQTASSHASGVTQKASAAASQAAGSSSSGSSGAGSGNSGSGGSGNTTPPQPAKPKTVYQVSVLFGESAGAPSEAGQLKPYENLKLLTPLPSSREPLIVFRGVSDKGKLATFTVAGETILHGSGKCIPSASECQAIQLGTGESEQLQYLSPATGTVQSYELRLVSITATKASTARLASLWRGESRAGMHVLLRANLLAIPGLSLSSLAGVLVPAR